MNNYDFELIISLFIIPTASLYIYYRMLALIAVKLTYPWLNIEPFFTLSGTRKKEGELLKTLNSIPLKVINEKKTQINQPEKDDTEDIGIRKKKAFLEYLLQLKYENNRTFASDRDILDEVNTFMFAGHDTTTSALCSILWSLGYHPEMQEMVYNEISGILGDREATIEDLNQMNYMERFIKETLRLYPPAYILGRKMTEDVTLPSRGITLAAGTEIWIDIYNVHRNPEIWPDPENFDPDRFLSDRVAGRHPYGYLVFSAGPRNCIGQKFALLDLKAIVARVIMNYKIVAKEKIIHNPVLVLHTADGPNLSISKRNL